MTTNERTIVSLGLAALAFDVRERTISNWIVSSWGAAAKVHDPEGPRAAMVDIDILYQCVCRRYPDRDVSNYRQRLAAEQEKIRLQKAKVAVKILGENPDLEKIETGLIVPENLPDNLETATNKEKDIAGGGDVFQNLSKNIQSIANKEVTNVSEKFLKNNDQLLNQVISELNSLKTTVKGIQPDHTLLSQTTALASRRNAEIEKVQAQVAEITAQKEALSAEVQKLLDRRRGVHYGYLIVLLFIVITSLSIVWMLDKKSDTYLDNVKTANTEKENFSQQLEQEIKNNKDKQKLLEEQFTAKQQLLENELASQKLLTEKQQEINQLTLEKMQQETLQLQRNIKILEEENLLLLEQQKSVSMEPDSASLEGSR